MQAPRATLAILLCTMAICSQDHLVTHGADIPTACCFSYTSRPVKCKVLVSFFETSSLCSNPGIIFKTKRDRLVCANPRESWVQEVLARCFSRLGHAQSPSDKGVSMKQEAEHQKHHFPSMNTSPLDWGRCTIKC